MAALGFTVLALLVVLLSVRSCSGSGENDSSADGAAFKPARRSATAPDEAGTTTGDSTQTAADATPCRIIYSTPQAGQRSGPWTVQDGSGNTLASGGPETQGVLSEWIARCSA